MAGLQQIGLRHPRIRQVRRITASNGRGHGRLLLAEGLWAHRVLASLDAAVELFLWCPEAACSAEAQALGAQIAVRAACAYRISPRVLSQLCQRDQPDGMISLVTAPAWDADRIEFRAQALVLVADAIEFPGNLGALLRTIDACGADCLVITNRRTRLTHPQVFSGSRGMSLRVPVIEFAEPAGAARWLAERHFTVFLATVSPGARPYQQAMFGSRTAVVVGNEHSGPAAAWLKHAPEQITIPMRGLADSLNVAVSASILLYGARDYQDRRQRSGPGHIAARAGGRKPA